MEALNIDYQKRLPDFANIKIFNFKFHIFGTLTKN